MSASFDELLKTVPQKVLKRELSEEERSELLELSSVFGMNGVAEYLYLILTFKWNEDKLREGLNQLTAVSENINSTLKENSEKILRETISNLMNEMTAKISSEALNLSNLVKQYERMRGHIILILTLAVSMSLGYFLGSLNAGYIPYWYNPANGYIGAFFGFPMGWVLILTAASYSFLWSMDNLRQIKRGDWKSRSILGLQILAVLLLLFMAI